MPAAKTVKPKLPKTSPKDKAKAAVVRASLPPKNVSDSDVCDLAKSLSAFKVEVNKAKHF